MCLSSGKEVVRGTWKPTDPRGCTSKRALTDIHKPATSRTSSLWQLPLVGRGKWLGHAKSKGQLLVRQPFSYHFPRWFFEAAWFLTPKTSSPATGRQPCRSQAIARSPGARYCRGGPQRLLRPLASEPCVALRLCQPETTQFPWRWVKTWKPKMGCPGKWNGPTPAVCPSCLILSHTYLKTTQ